MCPDTVDFDIQNSVFVILHQLVGRLGAACFPAKVQGHAPALFWDLRHGHGHLPMQKNHSYETGRLLQFQTTELFLLLGPAEKRVPGLL